MIKLRWNNFILLFLDAARFFERETFTLENNFQPKFQNSLVLLATEGKNVDEGLCISPLIQRASSSSFSEGLSTSKT